MNTSSRFTFSTLKGKAVINATDGSNLGTIHDLEISPDLSHIKALILPGISSIFPFKNHDEVYIPIENVEHIGEDVVLVRKALRQNE